MDIFGPKSWVFGKKSIFRLFELVLFFWLEKRFFVLEYHKRHFPGLFCLKKKVGKMGIFGSKSWDLDQNRGFGKMSIFRLFELLVFIA